MLPFIRIVAVSVVLLWLPSVVSVAQTVEPVASPVTVGRPAPALSELQQLKKQAFLLRVELAQVKARLADREQRVQALETVFRLQTEAAFAQDSQQLSQQCKALEIEFREALKVDAAKQFNCVTLEFAP